MPSRNPRKNSNWNLRCKTCGATWLSREAVETVQHHFATVHFTDKVSLELVWVGVGPAPKAPGLRVTND